MAFFGGGGLESKRHATRAVGPACSRGEEGSGCPERSSKNGRAYGPPTARRPGCKICSPSRSRPEPLTTHRATPARRVFPPCGGPGVRLLVQVHLLEDRLEPPPGHVARRD